MCHQHPLLVAIAGAALKSGTNVGQWNGFADNFAATISKKPPSGLYKLRLGAALDMSLKALSADACKLFWSLGAWPHSRIDLVRSALACYSDCEGPAHLHPCRL